MVCPIVHMNDQYLPQGLVDLAHDYLAHHKRKFGLGAEEGGGVELGADPDPVAEDVDLAWDGDAASVVETLEDVDEYDLV